MERNVNIKIDIDDRAPTSYNDLIKIGDSINLTIDLSSKGESVDLKDSSVELFLKKEDGTKVEQEVIIGDSKVSCTPLNIQSTAAVGQVCGELVVESSGKQVTSSTFIFNVEGSTSSEVLEESKDDIATIKSLQNTIVNVNSVVEKYKTNIEAIAGTSESIEALAQIKIYAETAVTEIETVVNTGNTLKTSLEFENTRAENNIQELNNLGSESIKTHINNTDIHVAASDKTKWDSYEQLISDNTSLLNENANAIEILNKKDLRTNIHLTDATIFSPTLTSSHECWNKWVSVEGNNMEYAPHPGALWGEVFTGGTSTRAFQIFISVFDSARKIYVRYKHDSNWSEFRYFGTGYIKELELKNGWVKFDLTPTYSLTGNTLSVNARIKSGVTSANTLIAETGFYASGGQSSFYNCYTPTGQHLGTISFTNDGRILIVNEFSSNADVCFNFSVCVN